MTDFITLLGSSSGRNAGDASIISGIIKNIDQVLQELSSDNLQKVSKVCYQIPTIRPNYIKQNYKNYQHGYVTPISMMPWALSLKMLGIPTLQAILRSDISLIFDAVLFDKSLYNPLFNYMSTLAMFIPFAKKKGRKIGCFNVGLGPIDTKPGAKMLKNIINSCDFVTLRDYQSYDLMSELGIKHDKVLITADSALIVEPSDDIRISQIMKKMGFSLAQKPLAVNINSYMDTWVRPKRPPLGKERFLQIMALALNKFALREEVPLLFVCTQHSDVAITKELMAKIDPKIQTAIFTNVDHNHYDVKGVLGKCAMLLGMRLHATILATSMLTPTLSIEYKPKVRNYFSLIEQEQCCLSFENYNIDGLYEHLVKGWQEKDLLKKHLANIIPFLQRKAYVPGYLVANLLLDKKKSFDDIFVATAKILADIESDYLDNRKQINK